MTGVAGLLEIPEDGQHPDVHTGPARVSGTGKPEFVRDDGQVLLHAAHPAPESLRDTQVRAALGDQGQNASLVGRQRVDGTAGPRGQQLVNIKAQLAKFDDDKATQALIEVATLYARNLSG